MVQFLGESVLIALISLVLALALTELLLPFFDRMLGKPIALDYLSDWPLASGAGGAGGLDRPDGGLYPALVLSGFRPPRRFAPTEPGNQARAWCAPSLVVMQFAVSIGLGIAALVVFAQISLPAPSIWA